VIDHDQFSRIRLVPRFDTRPQIHSPVGATDAPTVCAERPVLPTDGVARQGPAKRIAAITTAYWKYSHADDIITKFIEGYAVVGRTHLPHCKVVSLYVEQFPDTDIGRGMAGHHP
jgi:hypothetical protein